MEHLLAYLTQIQSLISKNKVSMAIDKLLNIDIEEHKNDFISISARYEALLKNKNKGIITDTDANIEERKITATILTYLSQIEKEIKEGILLNVSIATDETRWKQYIQSQKSQKEAYTEMPLPDKNIAMLHEKTLTAFLQTERVKDELLVEGMQIDEQNIMQCLQVFDLVQDNWLLKGTFLSMGERKGLKAVCPTIYPAKFAVYDDEKGIDLRITKEINGNLLLQYEDMMRHIRQNLYLERDLKTRTEDYEIPLRVLQELIANAFIHRDYKAEVNSFIQIEIYPNRIEIKNPGKFPEGILPNNIENTIIASKFQNPSVAHIFYLQGIVEKLGSGIKRAQAILLDKTYKPAVFSLSPTTNEVKVTVYKRNGATNGIKYIEEKIDLSNLAPIQLNNYLIGRKNELHSLHQSLQKDTSITLLNGMGGIGKTTLALFYCNSPKFKATYDNIIWIPVSNITSDIQTAFIQTFMQLLKLSEKPNEEQFLTIIQFLQKIAGKNLIVIDNANNPDNIMQNLTALKQTHWKILLISRAEVEIMNTLTLNNLPHEDALALFSHYYSFEIDTLKVEQLLLNIDYHTLLIEFTAKILKHNPTINIEKLLEITEKHDFTNELFNTISFYTDSQSLTHQTPKKIKPATYLLELFPLISLSEDEKQVLLYFSVLPSEWIEINALISLFTIHKKEIITPKFIQILNNLQEKGWIQKNNVNAFRCHILIQQIVRQQL